MTQAPDDSNPAAEALNGMLDDLKDSAGQLKAMAASLQDVMAQFEAGALTGPPGDEWHDQIRDKLIPFVDETQQRLANLAGTVKDAVSDAAADEK